MTSPNGDRSTYRFEVMVAALMALTTLLAAWSGFQSTKWSGIMAIRFNEAGALRSESLRSSNLAATQRAVDVGLFTRWVDAYADGNQELVEFYEQRFPERLGVAVDAWVATEPLTSPDAPVNGHLDVLAGGHRRSSLVAIESPRVLGVASSGWCGG
jgi:hypothetical protein